MRHPKPIMADPGQTAQRNRASRLKRRRGAHVRISLILWGISLLGATASASCSDGESGLVLGRPLPETSGGSAGTTNGGAPGLAGEAGTAEGGAPLGKAGAAGEAGASGAGGVPPTIEELCTPTILFDNVSPDGDGKAFNYAVPDPSEVMWEATHAVCRELYRDSSEVKPVPEITLSVVAASTPGTTAGTRLTLGDAYIKMRADAGEDVRAEITGILCFQSTFVYGNGGRSEDRPITEWVRYGMADFIRLRAGYIDPASRHLPTANYDASSSQTVAFFFEYLAGLNPDIVYLLNQRLASTSLAWDSAEVFTALMGKPVGELWEDYKATF
jgi:hypothetical protein